MAPSIVDHGRAGSIAGSPRPRYPPKLRQTCDSCSEAKVKCDKGSPRCGRCDRLSYDCVYSPAKRIGRPRPRPLCRSPDRGGGEETAPGRDDDGAAAGQAHEPRRPLHLPQALAAQPAPRTAGPDLHLNLDDLVSEYLSGESYWSTSDGVATNTGASTHGSDGPVALISNGAPFPTPSLGGSGHFGDGHLESASSSGPDENDCASAAAAMLGVLGAAGLNGPPPPPPPPPPSSSAAASQAASTTAPPGPPGGGGAAAAADVLAEHIPQACRQAARMLVCPCSADMDRALLAASLVAAILEAADAALRRAPRRPAAAAAAAAAGGDDDEDQYTVLALGTLPKIAQVVMLFARRYGADQGGRPPPDALLRLAASLRATLQAVAEGMTDRFLSSGTTPSACG